MAAFRCSGVGKRKAIAKMNKGKKKAGKLQHLPAKIKPSGDGLTGGFKAMILLPPENSQLNSKEGGGHESRTKRSNGIKKICAAGS